MTTGRTSTEAVEVDLVNAALLGTDRRDVPTPPGTHQVPPVTVPICTELIALLF